MQRPYFFGGTDAVVVKPPNISETIPNSGLFQTYVARAQRLTDAPSIYHVGALLGTLSAVLCPHTRLVFKSGDRQHHEPLQLWILLAGKSNNRKSHALDMATTVSSYGKIKLAAQKGESIPVGWMVDRKGQPLTDPRRAGEGFLVPIGGYKGYGLNVIIGMLAGVLNGALFGRGIVDFTKEASTAQNGGHMIFAMRVDNFQPVEAFKREMDRVIREIRDSKRMEGVDRIWLPGEMEFRTAIERRKHGIPISRAVVEGLRQLAKELNLPDRLEGIQ